MVDIEEDDEGLTEQLEIEIRQILLSRFNTVTGIVEYSTDGGNTYQNMSDRMERIILRRLKANGHKVGISTVRNILSSDFSVTYDPFVEYFTSLPEWDEQTNYISQLCSLVDVKNSENWEKWFTKWLVSMVAGVLSPKTVNHQMLVLIGGQGIGKTTWLDNLVPIPLKRYANTGFVSPDSKDALIQASECMLVNIDELSSMGQKNLEAFKQLITQLTIRVRRPYGFNAETLIKRASFCGSTNEEQFLVDTTGNRRFLCFHVADINLDALQDVDMNLVYSQAYKLYESGFQFWFDKDENREIELNNESYVVRTVEEELITQRFKPCGADEVSVTIMRWTATEVALALQGYGVLRYSSTVSQKIGKALVSLGFHRYKSNGRMLYLLKLK